MRNNGAGNRPTYRKEDTTMQITIRQLRQALTAIDDQEMTAKELRAKLFEQEEQDTENTSVNDLIETLYWATI